MLIYLLYFAVFIAAVFVFELVLAQLRVRTVTKRAANRRMQLLEDSASVSRVDELLREERGLSMFRSDQIRNLYAQSGIAMTPANLAGIALTAAMLVTLLAHFFIATLWVKAIIFVVVLVAVPVGTLVVMRRRRVNRFSRQLPDALDIIVRSLKAGHPFNTAVNLVGREMADPIGTEFGLLADELGYGVDLDTALDNLSRRVGADDLRFVSISLNINRKSGGNLAEVLENLSRVIRNRYLIKAKIKSLSAEGRFSAKLMSVWPLLMWFVVQWLAPDYFEPIYDAGIEVPYYGFCIVMTIIGNIVLTKMVNFDF